MTLEMALESTVDAKTEAMSVVQSGMGPRTPQNYTTPKLATYRFSYSWDRPACWENSRDLPPKTSLSWPLSLLQKA
jgi:hypothetical protein